MNAKQLRERIQDMLAEVGSDLNVAMIDPGDRRNSYFGVFNAATDGSIVLLSPFADNEQSEQPSMKALAIIEALERMSEDLGADPEVFMVDAYAEELSLVEIKSAAMDAGMILLSPFDFVECEATDESIEGGVQ